MKVFKWGLQGDAEKRVLVNEKDIIAFIEKNLKVEYFLINGDSIDLTIHLDIKVD